MPEPPMDRDQIAVSEKIQLENLPTVEMMTALAEWQATHYSVIKDQKTKAGVQYEYASECAINTAIKDLKSQGFAHFFTPRIATIGDHEKNEPNLHILTLYLVHAPSGGCLKSELAIREFDPNNRRQDKHQQQGGAISYAKRYLLPALLGIAVGGDEGEGVAEEPPRQAQRTTNGNGVRPIRKTEGLQSKNLATTRHNTNVPDQTAIEPKISNESESNILKDKLNTAFEKIKELISNKQLDRDVLNKYVHANTDITADAPKPANFTTVAHLKVLESIIKMTEQKAAA